MICLRQSKKRKEIGQKLQERYFHYHETGFLFFRRQNFVQKLKLGAEVSWDFDVSFQKIPEDATKPDCTHCTGQ